MGIFKSTKARNIFIYSICALGVAASVATICVVLWPKDNTSTNVTTTNNSSSSDSTHNSMYDLLHQNDSDTKSDGPLYTTVPCEEASKITGQNCDSSTSTPNYSAPSTYTPSDTSTTTPSTPTYNVPDYTPTPAPTPTCADYHSKYYSEYQTQLSSTNSHYNSAISDASISCAGNGGSFGGCSQITNLERQWQAAVAQIKNSYKTNMSNVGCDPSQYVNF